MRFPYLGLDTVTSFSAADSIDNSVVPAGAPLDFIRNVTRSTYVCVPSVSGASCGIDARIVFTRSSALDPFHREKNSGPANAGAPVSPSRSALWQGAHDVL